MRGTARPGQHGRMAVNTAVVAGGGMRPRTGFPFLDAGLDAGRDGAVLAFAHRGGALHPEIAGLENTLVAFEHAVRLGYTYLETDVRATRDGVLLAFHDEVLDRVTASVGSILEASYVDVRTALIAGREPIPRMADLLEHRRDRMQIDLGLTRAGDTVDRCAERHRFRPDLRTNH